jgi:aminomethyltransferase
MGGRRITDYAPDFWLISGADGGDPLGYVTSPWYSPELGANIAMGYVPLEMAAIGTALTVWLPEQYAEIPGHPVEAKVAAMPFRASANPSARERALSEGRDFAY